MRVENSIRNGSIALIGQVVSLFLGFVTRTVFIYTLHQEYLGINGIFASVLSLLSLSELGLGTAITFALYQPIAVGNEKKISALMNLYSKAYHIVGVIVAILGITLIPFLDKLIKNVPHIDHLVLIYLLFLSNTVLSYFFVYKRSLLIASQKDYLNTVNQSIFLLLQNSLQIVVLLVWKNYLLYLIVQIGCVFFSNVMISRKTDRLFPYLKENKKEKLDIDSIRSIKKNVSAMILHQFGSVAVTGTDNLMIAWVDVVLAGIYSNYALIVQMLTTILRQIFTNPITASMGNLVAIENKEKQYATYKNILLVNFWLYGFCAIALNVLIEPFILTVWRKESYLLELLATNMIAINFFLTGMRQTNLIYINAAGLFYPLRYKSFLEAVINLGASFYFLVNLQWGIYGVLLGTFVSTITTNFWWEPYIVYKHGLKQPLWRYFVRILLYFGVGGIAFGMTFFLCRLVPFTGWIGLLLKGGICAIVPNGVFLIAFIRTPEFQYFQKILLSIRDKIKKK